MWEAGIPTLLPAPPAVTKLQLQPLALPQFSLPQTFTPSFPSQAGGDAWPQAQAPVHLNASGGLHARANCVCAAQGVRGPTMGLLGAQVGFGAHGAPFPWDVSSLGAEPPRAQPQPNWGRHGAHSASGFGMGLLSAAPQSSVSAHGAFGALGASGLVAGLAGEESQCGLSQASDGALDSSGFRTAPLSINTSSVCNGLLPFPSLQVAPLEVMPLNVAPLRVSPMPMAALGTSNVTGPTQAPLGAATAWKSPNIGDGLGTLHHTPTEQLNGVMLVHTHEHAEPVAKVPQGDLYSQAELWLSSYVPSSVVCSSRVDYPSGASINLPELALTFNQVPFANSMHWTHFSDDLQRGTHLHAALQVLRERDPQRAGTLSWRSGELYNYVLAVLLHLGLDAPSEAQVYDLYTRFDEGGLRPLCALECLCLIDALLRALFWCTPLDVSQVSPSAQPATCSVGKQLFCTGGPRITQDGVFENWDVASEAPTRSVSSTSPRLRAEPPSSTDSPMARQDSISDDESLSMARAETHRLRQELVELREMEASYCLGAPPSQQLATSGCPDDHHCLQSRCRSPTSEVQPPPSLRRQLHPKEERVLRHQRQQQQSLSPRCGGESLSARLAPSPSEQTSALVRIARACGEHRRLQRELQNLSRLARSQSLDDPDGEYEESAATCGRVVAREQRQLAIHAGICEYDRTVRGLIDRIGAGDDPLASSSSVDGSEPTVA